MKRLDAITTAWRLLFSAHYGDKPTSEGARDALVRAYLPAVRRYLEAWQRRKELDAHDVDDVAQETALTLLQPGFAEWAPREERFRDYLLRMTRDAGLKRKRSKYAMKPTAHSGKDIPSSTGTSQNLGQDTNWLAAFRRTLLENVKEAITLFALENPRNHPAILLSLAITQPESAKEELKRAYQQATGEDLKDATYRQLQRRGRFLFARILVEVLEATLSKPTTEQIFEELCELEIMAHVKGFLPPNAWNAWILETAWEDMKNHQLQQCDSSYTVLCLSKEHASETAMDLVALLEKQTGLQLTIDELECQLRHARFLFAQFLLRAAKQTCTSPTPERLLKDLERLDLMPLIQDFLPADWLERGELSPI